MCLCIFIRPELSGTLRQASAPPAVDPRVSAAAQTAFSKPVQDHVFKGTPAKKNSGRHILSAWTKDNPKSAENKRDDTTGIVEFQVSGCKREITDKVLKTIIEW